MQQGIVWGLIGVGVVLAGVVRADDNVCASEKENCTLVTLSGEAHRQVTQDKLQGTLSIQTEGATASAAQAALNAKMQDAKPVYDAARGKDQGLKVSTGGYSVYQQQDGDAKTPRKYWRASQPAGTGRRE